MNQLKTILILSILAGVISGCVHPKKNDQPQIMSKEEALHILNDVDPYSREAMHALEYHIKNEREVEREQRLEEYKNCPLLKSPLITSNSPPQDSEDSLLPSFTVATINGDFDLGKHICTVLAVNKIHAEFGGSMTYYINVPNVDKVRARLILKEDSGIHGYKIEIKKDESKSAH